MSGSLERAEVGLRDQRGSEGRVEGRGREWREGSGSREGAELGSGSRGGVQIGFTVKNKGVQVGSGVERGSKGEVKTGSGSSFQGRERERR
eukprot:649645-Rhodomonas_salina.2